MPLGKRQDFGDARFAGLEIGFTSDIETAVEVRKSLTGRCLMTSPSLVAPLQIPLLHATYSYILTSLTLTSSIPLTLQFLCMYVYSPLFYVVLTLSLLPSPTLHIALPSPP